MKTKTKSKSKVKAKSDMTPLEKARAARAAGKGAAKPKKKNALPTFKAPEEFKPHFLEIVVKTEKDGLLSNQIKATRYQGRYDPEADDKKKTDLGSYDPVTLTGIHSRLSMTTYVTNPTKRLPANTTFKLLVRVNRKSADGTISVGFKNVWEGRKIEKAGKPTKIKAVELDKKDPNYRKFRKSSRILPAAFKNVLMPPKKVRGKRVEAEE